MESASEWVRRWSHLVPPQAPVLDVACGRGRHLHWFQRLGHPVTGIDRNPRPYRQQPRWARRLPPTSKTPLAPARSAPVWRGRRHQLPLASAAAHAGASLAPGGVLLYETFASGNETVGRPAGRLLLQPGELLAACASLQVVAYETDFSTPARFVQRIAAVHAPSSGVSPARHPLPRTLVRMLFYRLPLRT